MFESFYDRYTFKSTWFPVSQLVACFLFNIIGWTFINLFNCSRSNPFTSGNGGYKDFKKLLLFTPVFFLLSGLVIYRSRHSLSGYCSKGQREILLNQAHPN